MFFLGVEFGRTAQTLKDLEYLDKTCENQPTEFIKTVVLNFVRKQQSDMNINTFKFAYVNIKEMIKYYNMKKVHK